MSNRKNDYWIERFRELEEALNEKGLSYYRLLEKDYQEAARATINEIMKLYGVLAVGGEISLSAAKKTLSDSELDNFRSSLEAYIKFGKENGVDEKWLSELEMLTLSRRITRLQAMKVHIRTQAEFLYYKELNDVETLMSDTYEESYYKTAFEIILGLGLVSKFEKLTSEEIAKVISSVWVSDGLNLSERIWGKHRTSLIADLQKGLTQLIIRGESPDKLIKFINTKYNVSKAQAGRLVMTELAYVKSVGQINMFKELGVKQVEFVATLDDRTSEICRYMNGKVFNINELEIGINAPPLHPNCRSVLCSYFENNKTMNDEKAVTVDKKMTYKEFVKKYVENK